MKRVPFQSTQVILREYDLEFDPEKLVKFLFDKMNSEQGIKELKEGDKWLHDPERNRKRFVAEIDEELYATITVEQEDGALTGHRFRLYAVVTTKHYQGTGLSQLLFQYVKEWIREQQGKLVLVETWEDNIGARKFYKKIGFAQYAILPNGLKNRSGKGYVNEIMFYQEL